MIPQPTLIVHLVDECTPSSRLETLSALLSRRALFGRQLVAQLGPGAAVPNGALRVHVPCAAVWLGSTALGRLLAREACLSAIGTVILHAWSWSAAQWCGQLAAGHRPVLAQVDSEDDLRAIARWSGRRSVSLICPDTATRQRCIQHGVPAPRIALVRPLVDPAALEPSCRPAARAQLSLADGQPAILVLPPITRGTGALLSAWGALLLEKVRPDVRLVVPAGGRETERIRRLVDGCRHNHVARFASPRPLPQLLAAADLAVFAPPIDAPPSGLAWAMAAGCPIVATRVPAVRELLQDGHSAWLCRPDDPQDIARRLLHALESPLESRHLAEQARATAAALFGPAPVFEEYRRIYTNLATRRPAGAPGAARDAQPMVTVHASPSASVT